MTLLTPLADILMAGIIVVGSISVGYASARLVYPGVRTWRGWMRILVGGGIGVGWSILFFFALMPHAEGLTLPTSLVAEFFAYVGLGLLVVLGISASAMRVAHLFVQHTPKQTPVFSSTQTKVFTLLQPVVYKPSQLRQKMEKEPMAEPIIEETGDADAMDVLRDENASQKTRKQANAHENQTPARTPMSDLSDFSGFEDTLAQLKRDLKDFNDSMNKTHPQ